MCKGHINNTAFNKVRVAQSVEHQTTGLRTWVRIPLWAKTFHFVFCRFRRAPGKSTGPIQM